MAEVPENKKPLLLTNAEIFYRNFAGLERQYNAAGERNFCVAIDPVLADKLVAEGWNIKYRKQLEEGDPVRPYVEVKVNFGGLKPPKCLLISSAGRQELNEENIWALDAVELERVDLTINPYHYEVNGKKGVKAYLRSIFVTAFEDELDKLYAETPEVEEVAAVLQLPVHGDGLDLIPDPTDTVEADDGIWRGEQVA